MQVVAKVVYRYAWEVLHELLQKWRETMFVERKVGKAIERRDRDAQEQVAEWDAWMPSLEARVSAMRRLLELTGGESEAVDGMEEASYRYAWEMLQELLKDWERIVTIPSDRDRVEEWNARIRSVQERVSTVKHLMDLVENKTPEGEIPF